MESDSSKLDVRKDPSAPSACRKLPISTPEIGTGAASPNRASHVNDASAVSSTALPKTSCSVVDRPAKSEHPEYSSWKACQNELDAKARALITVLDVAMLYLVSWGDSRLGYFGVIVTFSLWRAG